MTDPSNQNTTIVGGGLVGALWAVYLGQRGHEVTVFDRRSDMRGKEIPGGRSINLALSDRGLKALAGVGIAKEIQEELCIPMHGRMMHDTAGNLTFQPYGKKGQYINSVSRSGLNVRLLDLADEHENVSLRFDQKCLKFDLKSKELLFHDLKSGENYTTKPDLIFGADGAYSRVRYSLQKGPRFDYSQDYLPHGYKELTIPPGPNGEWQIDKEALHIWPRGDFMIIALPNLDGSFTVTLFLAFDGPENSFEALSTPDKVDAFFETHFADARALMPDLTKEFFRNPTSGLLTVSCYPWAADNTLLLGDAAHAIVPFYGQGMNSGFEDCTLLAEILDANPGANWKDLFRQFELERKDDADAIAALAKRNFLEMRDHVADPRFLLRKKIAAEVSKGHPEQFLPVYSMVTFSHLPYSQGLSELHRQDQIFEEILDWKNIEQEWNGSYRDKIDEILLNTQEA